MLFYDIVGPAAVGTGVTRAQINAAYSVPSAARELVGVYLHIANEAPSAAEPTIAVFDIVGTDFRYQPCEALFPIGSGKLGAIDSVHVTPSEFWQINAPLNGTEKLDVGCEPCNAMAGNGQAAVTMVFDTMRTGLPPIYGKFSREVGTGTTAGTSTTLTAITLSNALKMYEIVAVAVNTTIVADQELMAYVTLTCTQWEPIQTIKFFVETTQAIEATSGEAITPKLTRLPFDANFKATQATIEGTAYNYDILTNAGVYVHGVRYYGTPK